MDRNLFYLSLIAGFGHLVNTMKVFSYQEDLIIRSIVSDIEIKHCIFVKNFHLKENSILKIKTFSNQKLLSMVINYRQLIEYLRVNSFPNRSTMIILKELNLVKVIEVFEELKELNILHRTCHFKWVIFLESYESFQIDRNKLLVPYNCQFIVSYPIDREKYELKEVYKVKNKLFFTEFGVLNHDTLLTKKNFLFSRRMNLNGTELEINFDDYETETMRGTNQLEILNDMAKIMMNFRFFYKRMDYPNFRNFDIPGDVYQRPLPFHADFFKPELVGPMFKVIVNWYIKHPNTEQQADFYTRPFHKNLWGAILLCTILGSLALIFLKKVIEFYLGKFKNASLIDVIFVWFETFCNQVGCENLNKVHFRIFLITLQMAALFIIPAYGATITSYLAVRLPQIPFRNLDEFVNNGKYFLLMRRITFTALYIGNSNDETLRRVYNNFSRICEGEDDCQLEFSKFCKEKMAFPSYDNDIYSAGVKCNFLKIQYPITFTLTGIALAKNSPFKEVFTYNLIKFYTSGIQSKLQEKTKDPFVVKSEESEVPVEIKQMAQVISMVCFGVVLAGIIVVVEICWNIYSRKRKYLQYKKRMEL